MKKRIIIIIALVVVILAGAYTLFAITASGNGMTLSEYFGKLFRKEIEITDSGVAAIVNGENIYYSEVDLFLQFSPSVDAETVLDGLIMQKIVLQEAIKRGYDKHITDEDVEKTIDTQMRYLKQIAAMPETKQTDEIRLLLQYLEENNISIEEYYTNEESWNTYRNMLIRNALLSDIMKEETDPDEKIARAEEFKENLKKHASIVKADN